jgi:homoserine O-acetyltransferase
MSTHTVRFPEFTLESGTVLHDVPVVYRSWGRLNAAGTNVVVVCHALTGSPDADDWWSEVVGPGRALDTHRYFVICANVIGSPYGTVSPLSIDPATGQPYGSEFPATTVRDTVALHRRLLESLGVQQIAFAIGGSLGGMQALEWAFHEDYVRGIVPIAVGGRHSAWCIGWSEAQRQAIYNDPRWQGGRYSPEEPPAGGLSVARMMAMVSYRSFASFGQRFGRERDAAGEFAGFQVENYLRHQGQKLVDRFDARCYVHLTEVMDTHDVGRGRGDYPAVLRRILQPTLVVGITTDVLYPLDEQRELVAVIPAAELAVIDAPQGHDAFLIEQRQLGDRLQQWRARCMDPLLEN